MGTARPEDPFVAHTGGSAEAAMHLRRNLAAIAEQHRGTAMAGLVREVLAGRRDLTDLQGDQAFMGLMRGGVAAYEDHLAALSPDEKERLYAEAREVAEADQAAGDARRPRSGTV